MNKAITFLAIAGLSLANQEELLGADNDLFAHNLAFFNGEELNDDNLFDIAKAIEWGLRNQAAIREGIQILKGNAADVFEGEDALNDDAFNLKDKIKVEIKKAAQFVAKNPQVLAKPAGFVAKNPQIISKVAQFIAKRANDNNEDDEFALLNGENTDDEFALFNGENIDDELALFNGENADDNLGLGNKIKNGIKKGANFVANNPQLVTKAAQFIAKRANDNNEDDELALLNGENADDEFALFNGENIDDELALIDGENADDNLGLGSKIKNGIKKGANFVANNPQLVTKAAQFIAKRANDNNEDDEFALLNGENIDEQLNLKDKIRSGIRNSAGFVAKNPKLVTGVAKFIAKRADDQFLISGEDVFIGF